MKKILCVLGALALLLCCTGCIRREPAPQPSASVAAPETTAAPTQPVRLEDGNPLHIQGYTYFETPTVNALGDVFLTAQLDADAQMEGKPLFSLTTRFWNEQGVLVEYTVDEGDEGYSSGLSWLGADGQPLAAVPIDFGAEVVDLGAGAVSVYSAEQGRVDCYGLGLESIGSFPLEEFFYAISSDGKRCYYVQRGALLCLENGQQRQIEVKNNYCVTFVHGVITDDAGTDYADISCMGGDLKYYRGILDCSSGEMLYVPATDYTDIQTEQNTYIETVYNEQFGISQWIICKGEQRWDCRWEGEPKYCTLYVLESGQVLFAEPMDNGLRLFLYSLQDGSLLDSTAFTIDNGNPVDPDSERGEVDLCQQPILLDSGRMLLQLYDGAGNRLYYVWKLGTADGPESGLRFEPYELGSRPSAPEPEGLNMHDYTPTQVREELEPLRQRADALEERMGIRIYLGEECACILADYAVSPLLDYDSVSGALDVLERELGKYPADFFRQMSIGSVQGHDFYIADTLMGIQDGTLSYAGGFQNEINGRQIIAIDCEVPNALATTLHHEIAHSIEDYMTALELFGGVNYLDEEQWKALNPDEQVYGDCYTYTYMDFGFEENWGFAYSIQEVDGDVSGTYFVDLYSMTFPWEDRARLFENWMSDDQAVDFEAAPHMKAKLDFFLDCMSRAFEGTGWTQAPWDQAA